MTYEVKINYENKCRNYEEKIYDYEINIDNYETKIDDFVHEKEILELEIETLQGQIQMMNGIQQEQETQINSLKETSLNQDNSLQEEFKKIEQESKKKSLRMEELALDLSMIEKEKKDIIQEKDLLSDRLSKNMDDNNVVSDLKAQLQDALEKAGIAEDIQKQLEILKAETEDDIRHMKGTLKTFLQNCPKTTKDNEAILSVIYSMLDFTPGEEAALDATRKKNFPMSEKAKSGKGLFGMFGKK